MKRKPYARRITQRHAFRDHNAPSRDAWTVELRLSCGHVVCRKMSQQPQYYAQCEFCREADQEKETQPNGRDKATYHTPAGAVPVVRPDNSTV